MHEVVVIADTSCLIALSNIQGISILRDLYRVVYITPEIADEFIPERNRGEGLWDYRMDWSL